MRAAPVALLDQQEEIAAPTPGEIGSLARHGAAWSAGLIACRYIANVGATAILARLLTATDYGLIGMVASVTALFQFFSDLGLSWATVQCKTLRRQQADNLFWINTGCGVALWAACALVGPVLNEFYGRTELAPVAAVLGVSFLFSGAAVQPMAILRRQMRFRKLTTVELCSHVAGALIGVSFALLHFGYWALVAQAVGSQCALAAGLMISGRYWPALPRFDGRTLPLLKFGGYIAAYNAVNYFSRNIDSVMIGRYWGAEQLGYYSRAYFLMTLPTLLASATFNAVMVPTLSALRDDAHRMEQVYRKAVTIVAIVAFPVAIGLAVTAREMVNLVYGPKWGPVASIFMWLSAAAVFQPVSATAGWLYIAAGKARAMFYVGLVTSLIVCVAFAIGNQWGSVGIAVAYASASLLVMFPALAVAHRVAGLHILPTMYSLAPFLIAAVAMGAVALLVKHVATLYTQSMHTVLLVTVASGAAFYMGLLVRFCPDYLRSPWRGWSPAR